MYRFRIGPRGPEFALLTPDMAWNFSMTSEGVAKYASKEDAEAAAVAAAFFTEPGDTIQAVDLSGWSLASGHMLTNTKPKT